ncbi:MAG: glutamyl-tRNA reductase [Clostridia bacterium]|nr:glutamyl-tRNA reductase [Clostridia bacterium]
MFCVSLNFHNTDVALRETFPHGPELLDDLEEGVLLSTCNRLEVYGVGDVYAFIETRFKDFKSKLFFYEDDQAVRHLFRVATGLDSMVLGEDEILGQLKNAYEEAHAAGKTGYELNTIFRGAVTAAKRVKTETLLSKTSVSVATLAASACVRFWDEQEKDRRANVLMIGGSGDIGGKLLKDLASYDRFDLYATVREHGVRDIAAAVDYKDRYRALRNADIVISATRSPHFTVTADAVAEADIGLPAPKQRLYVDLAVPRDIDPALSPVLTIDDLEELAEQNNALKQDAAAEAEDILEEELDVLFKDLAFHELVPLLNDPPDGIQLLSEDRKRLLYTFREEASAEEFRAFTKVFLRLYESGRTEDGT